MKARELRPARLQPKAWTTPAVTRLSAGGAEFQQTNGNDGFIAAS